MTEPSASEAIHIQTQMMLRQKSLLGYLLLWFFFGWLLLGIHRFYVKSIGGGFAYIILGWVIPSPFYIFAISTEGFAGYFNLTFNYTTHPNFFIAHSVGIFFWIVTFAMWIYDLITSGVQVREANGKILAEISGNMYNFRRM